MAADPIRAALPEDRPNVKSCGATRMRHNSGVEQPVQAPTELPLRPQDEVECRRCEVHCDKVVYPGACIERSCPFVYAYEAWGHTYVGCMQRVYAVEIDLDLLRAAEARAGGFGGIRATGAPLPMCKVEVAACYECARRRARLPEPRVPRDPARAPELPRLRPDHARARRPRCVGLCCFNTSLAFRAALAKS